MSTIKPFFIGIVTIFISVYVATVLGWYPRILHIDKLFHIAGGIIVAWFFTELFIDKLRLSFWQRLLLLSSLAALVGVLWEIAEYTSATFDYLIPNIRYYLYNGDLYDTLIDLVADLFGGLIFAFIPRKISGK